MTEHEDAVFTTWVKYILGVFLLSLLATGLYVVVIH
jgi:hypothetical protein